MICTNVDKCSAKIFFAVSMGYSACLFQVLIETFSRKLTNLLWSAMASFGPQSDFPKTFCSIFFSLVNGCLIQNALCSDVICSRIAIDGQPLKESLAVSICNKILFFSLSLLFGYFLYEWFKRNHVIWHFWTMYFWSSSGVYLHVFCFQLQIIGFQYQQFFLVLGWYFNLESAVNLDCIFSFSSCVIRRA